MRPDSGDAAYLWDMREHAQRVIEMVAGIDLKQYARDQKTRMAVERGIEIIGEAARHVSSALRQAHPEIPWSRIIGQRNVLIHEYGAVIDDLVWETASRDVPEMLRLLEPLMPRLETH
jgi:uncharacterized protein with HEPN domain